MEKVLLTPTEKRFLTPKEICDFTEEVGINKANNKAINTLLLSILAGIFISIGAFSATVASHGIKNYGLSKLVSGIVFPVGLMLVLVCGAELFTGNNLLSVAYAEKKITFTKLMRNWVLVYIGNFIGAFIFALLIYYSGAIKTNEGLVALAALKTASAKEGLNITEAFLSGILCNIVVCASVWGSFAARDVVSKIFMAFFPIMAFVISGFEHCVANMYYLTIAQLIKKNAKFVDFSKISSEKLELINMGNLFKNLSAVTLGNIIGGAIFIGIFYWIIFKKKK